MLAIGKARTSKGTGADYPFSGTTPSSSRLINASKTIPISARRSVAPCPRSTMAMARSMISPKSRARSTAATRLPPVVATSSTMIARWPAETGPSTCCPVPWAFCSLRTINPRSGMPTLVSQSNNGGGYRVGTNRHSADAIRQVIADQIQHSGPDQIGSLAVKCHFTAIQVKAGRFTGSKLKRADPHAPVP